MRMTSETLHASDVNVPRAPPFSSGSSQRTTWRLLRSRGLRVELPELAGSSIHRDLIEFLDFPRWANRGATKIASDVHDATTLNASLAEELCRVLHVHIPKGPVALADYPRGPNVGDHAIWLGQKAFLRDAGMDVVFECDRNSFSSRAVDRSLKGGGSLLLHGGGNIGDIWDSQHLREEIIARLPNHRIIQLPQSIHFNERANLERAKRVFNEHSGLVLLLRDRHSLDFARQHFDAPSELCPDMAFWLGHIDRPTEPNTDILWLSRTDVESATGVRPPISNESVRVTDWLSESPGTSWPLPTHLRVRAAQYAIQLPRFVSRVVSPPNSALSACYDFLSRERLKRGLQLLSGARIVVTDRLHGHILCQLLGIPHVLMDNSYGKINAFWETWTKPSPLVYWADTPKDALEMALGLAESQ
jgi:exopolysaccharide biosynthesis predicted pyruvyltransferase EpsI